ncbi:MULTISPECIES: SDR family oxidoreductase [Rahnella]|uniref:SDR family oxidoreductase n=1 Tax=Rahnella TaxID=34037 RepID=UPI0010A45A5E|nr:SDR family oxidoreductase [Rahnella rivi]MBB6114499.1 nucleoside-diphosphate-sugar epimerase [Rahnella inusitata]MBU9830783.1 SDR family oxidoreductase [Rahnella rivi]THD41537.1 SDR family oxidoreductase [Enterobacteriaceae bacterium ML5]
MKKVSIIGLGWLGMPLAMALAGRGYDVVGSKTTPDGVDAARMVGIDCYPLVFTPEMECEAEDLDKLLNVDALIITLPARRTVEGSELYFQAVQQLTDSALAHNVKRIIFTSSTSVYGERDDIVREGSALEPVTSSGKVLKELESWLHSLPHTSVDVLRLAGLVGGDRHPGRFMAGKTDVKGGQNGVNLVHQDDVVAAITLLLSLPKGGHTYNLCAPKHPAKAEFYPALARQMGLEAPTFAEETSATKGKIVDGERICKELGFEYQYPDPRTMPF